MLPLRVLVLLLLLLAFLDPRWPLEGRVVYLLDFSPSAREAVFCPNLQPNCGCRLGQKTLK